MFSAKRRDNSQAPADKDRKGDKNLRPPERNDGRANDHSARSGLSSIDSKEDASARSFDFDEEATFAVGDDTVKLKDMIRFAQYMLPNERGGGQTLSYEDAEFELKRIPTLIWIIQCALSAPLPPFWQYYIPPDKNETPFYTNTNTNESSWSHPSDPTFKTLSSVLTHYTDHLEQHGASSMQSVVEATDYLRTSLKNIYTGILQQ